MGPTLILTLPLKVFGSTTSDSSAPGKQVATRFTSSRNAYTLSGGVETLNSFSIRIAASMNILTWRSCARGWGWTYWTASCSATPAWRSLLVVPAVMNLEELHEAQGLRHHQR